MNKLDYFKLLFEHNAYAEKTCLVSLVTLSIGDERTNSIIQKVAFAVWVEENKYWFNDHEGTKHHLEGDVKDPVFRMDDHYTLPADFHPILRGVETTTTFGIFLFNIALLWEPLDKKLPYYDQELTKGFLMGIIRDRMSDNILPEGEERPEDKSSVDACLEISRNGNYLEGILGYIVKCGSMDTLSVNPAVIKRKNELIKQYADTLNDPVVFNSIIEELVELDYEFQMKGASASFYIDKSYVSNCRKRMFIMFGIEYNSEHDEWIPITGSLVDGWDPNLLVDYINTAIEGAYNRGKATGEGGARVKDMLGLMASSHVASDNCGVNVYEDVTIYPQTSKIWIGSYALYGNQTVELTKDLIDKMVDKTIQMRVPQFCETPDGNYCKTCLGKGLGSYGSRLGSDASNVPTGMMLQRMKASHISGSFNKKISLTMTFR